jgi:hypothetical protein
MPSLTVVAGIVFGALCAGGATTSVAAETQAKPKPGQFAGTETAPTPIPISFRVTKSRKRVTHITGAAQVKSTGCDNAATSFGFSARGAKINRVGHFRLVYGPSYFPTSKGTTVTITGHFTSTTRAAGHVSVRIKHKSGCDASLPYAAHRTKEAT